MRSVRDEGEAGLGGVLVGSLALLPLSGQKLLHSEIIVVSYGRRSKAIQLFSHQQPAWVLLNVKWSQDTLVTLPLTPRAC